MHNVMIYIKNGEPRRTGTFGLPIIRSSVRGEPWN